MFKKILSLFLIILTIDLIGVEKIDPNKNLINYYKKELKKDSSNLKALKWVAFLYYNSGDFKESEKYYKLIIEKYPKEIKGYIYLAKIYNNLTQYPKAMEFIEKGLKIDPKSAELYSLRAFVKNVYDDYSEAEKDITKAIELDSKNKFFYFQRAMINLKQNLSYSALKDLNKAIELNIEKSEAYFFRGMIYQYNGDSEQALKDIQKAIYIEPKGEYFRAKGDIYYSKRMSKEALFNYKQAFKLNPKDKNSLYPIIYLAFENNNMDNFCDGLDKLMKIETKGDQFYKKMVSRYEQYCNIDNPGYFYHRGIAFYNKREYKKSIEIYSEGLKKFKNNPMLLNYRGNSYYALKQFEKGAKDYIEMEGKIDQIKTFVIKDLKSQALPKNLIDERADSFISSVYANISDGYYVLGDYKKSIEMIDKGLSGKSFMKSYGKEYFYNIKGNILIKLKKYSKAIDIFNKAMEVNGKFSFPYINRVVAKLGERYPNLIGVDKDGKINGISGVFNPHWSINVSKVDKVDKVDKIDKNFIKKLIAEVDEGLSQTSIPFFYYIRGGLKVLIDDKSYCSDFKYSMEYYTVSKDILKKCGLK